MTRRNQPPPGGSESSEAPTGDGENVHRLDTRQAELGQDLRRLFAGVLDEELPLDLAALGVELEAKLAAAGGPGPPPRAVDDDA